MHYALFPADKKGQKVADSLELMHGQKIRSTGSKKFYLEQLNLTKMSISTSINLEKKYGLEQKVKP